MRQSLSLLSDSRTHIEIMYRIRRRTSYVESRERERGMLMLFINRSPRSLVFSLSLDVCVGGLCECGRDSDDDEGVNSPKNWKHFSQTDKGEWRGMDQSAQQEEEEEMFSVVALRSLRPYVRHQYSRAVLSRTHTSEQEPTNSRCTCVCVV
jgi:hypothetical protein